MNLSTQRHPWKKLQATNFTDTSFAARKSTLTRPTGAGVIDLGSGNANVLNTVLLKFFGTDTNNQNFNVRVLGWDQETTTGSWEFQLLAQFAVTLGNLAGTALCAMVAADFEADTIAVTYGNSNVSAEVISPANDVRGAVARVDAYGATIIEVLFDRNSSAVSANALWKRA